MSQSDQFDDNGVQRPLLTEEAEPEYGAAAANGTPASAAPEQGTGTFTQNLGAIEAFAIIISIVIGSGVFTSPGSIDANVPSPGAALVIWLVGGILAWTGASTLAELGTAIPGEGLLHQCIFIMNKPGGLILSLGGVQPYLQHIFGNVFGFLAAWTWIVAVMPATLAILSIVFIESIFSAAGVTDQAGMIEHKLLSIFVLVVINGANSISTRASTRLNNFFVVTKFVSILGVVVAGIVVVILGASNPNRDVGGKDWLTKPWFGFRESVTPDSSTIDWRKLSEWEMLGHYSAALYGALWAYSGWDKVSCKYPSCRTKRQLMPCRRFILRLNFRRQPASFHLLSILPFRQPFSVSLLQMQPTTFSFHGTWFLQPTAWPW